MNSEPRVVTKVERFQRTNTVRLFMKNGDWIEVRIRLSGAEKRQMAARAFTRISDKAEIAVDFAMLGLARTHAYVTEWSFTDHEDRRIPVSPEAIDSLNEETLVEIERLLDKHCEEQDKLSKAASGAPASSPDSSVAGSLAGRGRSTNRRQRK